MYKLNCVESVCSSFLFYLFVYLTETIQINILFDFILYIFRVVSLRGYLSLGSHSHLETTQYSHRLTCGQGNRREVDEGGKGI